MTDILAAIDLATRVAGAVLICSLLAAGVGAWLSWTGRAS